MFLERYRIGEVVAESEHHTVRRAQRIEDGRSVIIKSSTRQYPTVRELRKLEHEYHLLQKVQGPGVIAALDIERQSGRVALVLEDFGGERLPTRAGQGVPLSLFFPLASGVVRALGQVHAKGVIHKDVNPRNVLANPSTREVKLIDFSLSSELSREHAEAKPGTRLEGTVPYISPEQTGRMNRDLDYRSDYYSLGVTLFELLTGAQPFSAPDVLGYVHCHLSKVPPSARELRSHVPEGLAQLVAKLMAKSPDERYQSARGLLEDLAFCEASFERLQDVPAFELGRRDVPERFGVSQDLVGREAEVAELLGAFEETSRGSAKLLLVAGYSGIGKSSLIREIHKPVVDKRANFVSGKFEQLERNTPYGALLAALTELCRQVLTETEERLLGYKARFEHALGSNANVLIPLLPELGQIMGPQPAVAELPAREAQGRLQRVFRDFIQAAATPSQPLVIFLDDLQWTDGATPQLLVRLLGDEDLRYVLWIGAYRDNEVSESHLLWHALAELAEKRAGACQTLRLAPLSEQAVTSIVARTLHREQEQVRPLAGLLFQKTAGNPFFVNELMTVLHQRGAILFDAASGAWTWQDDQIAQASFSDNVVDLMVQRVRQLPTDTIECLRLAACLGNEVELGLLARVLRRPPAQVAELLWPALEQRLLLVQGDYPLSRGATGSGSLELSDMDARYRFPHDRVMQAVYSLLSAEERARAHLDIGRMLRATIPAGERQSRVFDFIDHDNLGRSLVSELAERTELSALNQVAGQRARRAAAYRTAVAYLETSLALLTPAEWDLSRSRHFECQRMRVECVFLSGQVERANQLSEELFALAPDRAALASAYCMKAAILEQQSRLAESVSTIIAGLRELGLELPEDPALIGAGIGAGVGKMQAHLERVRVDDLAQLPTCSEPLLVATTELLFQLIPPASQMNPPLFILAELVLFDLALTHGIVPGSAKNFMDCGIVLGEALGDHARAYRMGKVAFTLLDRITPTPLESAVNFVFGCFISHWGAPFQEGLEALARGHRRGVELGDVLHASYAIIHRAKSLLFSGKELGECQAQTDRAMAYTLETGSVGHVAVPRIITRALGQLSGRSSDSDALSASDAEFLAEIEKTGNGHFLLVLGQAQTLVNFVLGDLERAAHWDELATRYIGVGNGAFPVPDYYLFQALLAGQRWASATSEERTTICTLLEQHAAKLDGFAAVSPSNFRHKHKLVCAELARVRGASADEVLALHREAQLAAGNDFLHLRAISYELQAALWQDEGKPELARESLLEAYHLYRHWGATAKLRRMEQQHTEWLPRAHVPAPPATSVLNQTLSTITATMEGSQLDVASAIKATHAISSEVQPERLFGVLIQAIIENAGAQHGYLIIKPADRDGLLLAAQASVSPRGAERALPAALEACDDVAQEAVRFVARTHETLVLDDAIADHVYGQDAHVKRAQVRSLLCMPVLNQGRLLAVLCVENNAVSRAFTPARVILLRVIAGQAAISIANAELYANLEQKVAERTRQLAERNREVSAMLNSLEQGVFTIDEELRIQPRYSAHLEQLLGTRELAGRDCLEVLFHGSDLSSERLANMRAALEFSFGSPSVFAEPNKVHWARDFQRIDADGRTRSFEVDWTVIPDGEDNVTRVLVALRDMTLMKELRATAIKHARELDLVGQILDAGLAELEHFCASSRACLAAGKAALVADAAVVPALSRIARDLHTIKGNARLLGFTQLGSAVHRAEDDLHGVRTQDLAHARRQAELGIEAVEAAIVEYETVYRHKLAEVARQPSASGDNLGLAVASQIAGVKAGALGASEALLEIESLLARASAVPLSQIVKGSARVLPVVAQELGKRMPGVELEDRGLLLSPAWARVLREALVHAFQNALYHGIEAADERRKQGKPAQGTIRLTAQRSGRKATLRVSDDGRGVNLQALRALAGAASDSDEQTAERSFDMGVSTASELSEVSGRGVGLAALRDSVRSLGGDVRLVFTGPSSEGHRPFELVFELPQDAVLGDRLDPGPVRRSEPPRPARASELPPMPR